MPGREIHIAPGLSAGGCLRQAIHPPRGDLLANPDVLSFGPLRSFASLDQWKSVRDAYWRQIHGDEFSLAFADDLLANIARLREAESISLWIGIGAAEQLLLAWIVQALHILDIGQERLRVIQFVRTERGMDVWSLSLLHPDQIAAHPAPNRLSASAFSEINQAWSACTSGAPEDLLHFIAQPSVELPHLRSSLHALLDRFPDIGNGLTRADAQLLKYVQETGPKAARVIGYAMGNNFGPDMWGDAWLFSRLLRLADTRLPAPALALTGDPSSMRTCEVVLTDFGKSLLAGADNFVRHNGIDEWVLGIHLDSASGRVWYRTADSVVAR